MAIKLYNLEQLKQELSTLVGMEINKLYFQPEMNAVLSPDGIPLPESVVPAIPTGFQRFWGVAPGHKPFEIKCSDETYNALVADAANEKPTVENLTITNFEVKTSKKGTEYNHVFIGQQKFKVAL